MQDIWLTGHDLTYSRLAQLVERVTSNWAMACLRNDEVSRSSRLMGILFCPVLARSAFEVGPRAEGD